MLIFLVVLAAIAIFALTLKYPLISLFFFLTTSMVKPLLIMNFSFFQKVDYTLLCGILVLIAMMYSFIKNAGNFKDLISLPMGLFIALALILLFGVLYTSAPDYGFQKSTRFAILNLICFTSPLFFAMQIKTIRNILILLIVVGIIIAAGTLIAPHAAVARVTATTRASFFETSPLEAATMIATGALLCFCYFVFSYTSLKAKIFNGLAIPIMLTAVMISGSRGPFLGFGLCAIIALFMCRRQVSLSMMPVLLFMMVIGTVWLVALLPQESIDRTLSLFAGKYEAQQIASDRTGLFGFVFVNFHRHPIFGHGTGAYAMDMWGIDQQKYPHNVILELLYENGFIGVMVFVIFMLVIYRRWIMTKKIMHLIKATPEVQGIVNMVALLVIFTFMQAMKSSDIEGNRFMFFCCGLVLAVYKCLRDEYELERSYSAENNEFSNATAAEPLYNEQGPKV